MKGLRAFLDKIGHPFHKGGKLEKLYPAYEAIDTFLFTPADKAKGFTHVRDHIDLKRMMITVVWALTPCILMACYNTGLQAFLAMESAGLTALEGWRFSTFASLGLTASSSDILGCFVYGLLFFLPVYAVCMAVGGTIEAIFSIIRGHEINEGFLVTGMLFPLTLPPTIPLWQVGVGIAFGVLIGKEIFGGTGKNFLNPALTARAFLYFAYPVQLAGDSSVWNAAGKVALMEPNSALMSAGTALANVDGYSGATILGAAATGGVQGIQAENLSMLDAFLGFVPGSMGETSVIACILGAGFLIATGIGSWRIMAAVVLGAIGTTLLLQAAGNPVTNPMFTLNPLWHLVSGGLAFGLVFMATDPVSAAMTNAGKWVYGILIGFMTILIRVVNPAFPEGIMLAILFGNVFAPTIDYYVVKANIKRRMLRSA